jgi:hypothetical protein
VSVDSSIAAILLEGKPRRSVRSEQTRVTVRLCLDRTADAGSIRTSHGWTTRVRPPRGDRGGRPCDLPSEHHRAVGATTSRQKAEWQLPSFANAPRVISQLLGYYIEPGGQYNGEGANIYASAVQWATTSSPVEDNEVKARPTSPVGERCLPTSPSKSNNRRQRLPAHAAEVPDSLAITTSPY